MAFGDLPLDAPYKPNKGHEGGACNRQSCQAEPALWWNHGSHSWYCGDCARDIGDDPVNRSDWALNWFPKLGHPMFETREMIDAREAAKATTHEIATDAHFGMMDWPMVPRKVQSPSLQRILRQARRGRR